MSAPGTLVRAQRACWPMLAWLTALLWLPTAGRAGTDIFPRPFHILAHRCAAGHAPENTLGACENALALGVVELEFDVQLSRDDEVVLFHDAMLTEKTGHPGTVRDHSLEELKRMDLRPWFLRTHPDVARGVSAAPLASLREVLTAIEGRAYYHIELKSTDAELAPRVLQELDRARVTDKAMLTSFHLEQLERARALRPAVPCTLLIPATKRDQERAGDVAVPEPVRATQRQWIDRAHEHGCVMVGVAARDLTDEIVEYTHARGLQVRAWKVQSDADMDRAIAAGVNGMTTDWPDRLIRRQLEHLAGYPFASGGPPASDR